MQIDMVSFKKGKTKITYREETQKEDGTTFLDTITRNSNKPPTPAFIFVLEKMALIVPLFVAVNREQVENTEVHTVEFKQQKDNLGIVLSYTQQTKLVYSYQDSKTPEVFETEDAWTEGVHAAVLELMDEAERYVNGEYAQTELSIQ